MAEFCKACAVKVWGEDVPSDLKGITTQELWEKGIAAFVICEGCGYIQVDPDGNCVSSNCLEAGKPGHGASISITECLKEALKWWEEDVQYMTTGDYGGHNVFDDDPIWVKDARKLFK